MTIYPAIDIRGGKVVRLVRGDYDKTTIYSDTPPETAAGFYKCGASHLHIVDLDGARDGELSNFQVIQQTLLSAPLFTQVGGGIRDLNRVKRYLDVGVSRVIIGTAAVEDPQFLKSALSQYCDKIAVGVDARDGKVAIGGWLTTTDTNSIDFCKRLRDMGVSTVIYTDIAKDGMMQGPNHEVYCTLSQIEGLNIIASGGVSAIDDIEKLAQTGIHGAIIGKALYTGAVDLKAATALF